MLNVMRFFCFFFCLILQQSAVFKTICIAIVDKKNMHIPWKILKQWTLPDIWKGVFTS